MTQQKCNSPECNLFAEYKAPLSPDNLRQYQWFCLQHIKEYNKNWNYFENMTDEKVKARKKHQRKKYKEVVEIHE